LRVIACHEWPAGDRYSDNGTELGPKYGAGEPAIGPWLNGLGKEGEFAKESTERGFHSGSPLDCIEVDPACQLHLRHGLAIVRPGCPQYCFGSLTYWWSALGKPVQMAQEEGLVARLLPDDPNVEFLCATLGLLSPAIIAVDLIGVQQRHLKVEL